VFKDEVDCFRSAAGHDSIESWYKVDPDAAHAALTLGCMTKCFEIIERGKAELDAIARKDDFLRAAFRITPARIAKERSLLEKKDALLREALELTIDDILNNSARYQSALILLRETTPNQSTAASIEEILANEIIKEAKEDDQAVLDILLADIPELSQEERLGLTPRKPQNPIGQHPDFADKSDYIKSAKIKKKFTQEQCIEMASTFPSKQAWIAGSRGTYLHAKEMGWVELCLVHLNSAKKDRPEIQKMTKDECIKAASKCTSRTQWMLNSRATFNLAKKEGWLLECLTHLMGKENNQIVTDAVTESNDGRKKTNRSQTLKRFLADANGEDENNVNVTVAEMTKDEVAQIGTVKSKKWTRASCIKEGKSFSSIDVWMKSSRDSFDAAIVSDFYEDCISHMRPKWNKEACLASAKRFSSPQEWRKFQNNARKASFRFKCYAECTAHMKVNGRINGSVEPKTRADVFAEAKKFSSVEDWKKQSPVSFALAKTLSCKSNCLKLIKENAQAKR